jgi:hypothetical protein
MTTLISIPTSFNATQREAIGIDIINRIVERTEAGLDVNGNPFAPYKQSYKQTLEYKIGHGNSSKVNLTLTGELLGSLSIISHGAGFIKLGFDDSSASEKAKWIQSPTGQKAGKQTPRKFLGISEKDLNKILAKYESSNVAFNTNATRELSENLIRRLLGF